MKQILSLLEIIFKTPVRIIFEYAWIQHNTNHLEVFSPAKQVQIL